MHDTHLDTESGKDILTTRRKAFLVNIDPKRYGTFAEIGAGQEVVRWFFQAGGAAGTISKSISAYDMQVSDAIYGVCERYVCQERLEDMLDYEMKLNKERLAAQRGHRTAFFAFADTVKAASYKGTGECHGWMGIKFQSHPHDDDSQIIIHVRMLDKENQAQQEALGIVGVNLIYGACFHFHDPEKLISSLLDNLSTARIEIDMIEFSGIEFRHVDNRLMSLQLVQLGLSSAAMFGPDGTVLQPSESLYKKNILVERGSFRPVCLSNSDIIRAARERFLKEEDVREEDICVLMELTMNNLMATGQIDYQDFLARADLLQAAGHTVLISDYFEYYRLAAYLARFTKRKIGICMGAISLAELFDEKYYKNLEGGILESFGRLFKNDLKLYIYPYRDRTTGSLLTTDNLEIATHLKKLYGYLLDRGNIEQLSNHDPAALTVFSRDILKRIAEGDSAWEKMVDPRVATLIKERCYFGYCTKGD
ncbi:MAG: TonB-dependent receptor [Candidatus Methylacidiphilales bacterium]